MQVKAVGDSRASASGPNSSVDHAEVALETGDAAVREVFVVQYLGPADNARPVVVVQCSRVQLLI